MANEYTVTLLMSEFVTHDVRRFIVTRPQDFSFEPGHGVELGIDAPDWEGERRPFTPTSLPDDRVLEFIIKRYPTHQGFTDRLHGLAPGAKLLMSEPFGTISYRGPGVFLAGGAGITPFIAILRSQANNAEMKHNTVIFSNKSAADVICEKELRYYLGSRCILTCTGDRCHDHIRKRVDRDFLRQTIDDFNQNFYLCGPPGFMTAVDEALRQLGANPQQLVFER